MGSVPCSHDGMPASVPAVLRRIARKLLGACACLACIEAATAQQGFAPSGMFLQVGTVHDTRVLSGGLSWDWARSWTLGPGVLSPYVEASISQWRYRRGNGRGTGHLTQLAVTPVLRWRLDGGASPWFAEAGMGLSFTTSLYETADKRFSTRFNFGTHLGVGRNFGPRREHEVVLRVEHFSNAGIKQPNPGENFLQIRYAYRFR